MSKSSNSALPVLAGSLAFAGAVAAASLWSNSRHHVSSKDSDKNDVPPKSKQTPTDSEKLNQVVNASLEYFYHDLPAHIIGDMNMVRKQTHTEKEDFIHQIINIFFKKFYMVKGDRSVSTENTEDSSVSSSEDWDDEEYIEEKAVEQTPVSGSDAAALFLANALVAAQAMV